MGSLLSISIVTAPLIRMSLDWEEINAKLPYARTKVIHLD